MSDLVQVMFLCLVEGRHLYAGHCLVLLSQQKVAATPGKVTCKRGKILCANVQAVSTELHLFI